jgi:hypothetical protein
VGAGGLETSFPAIASVHQMAVAKGVFALLTLAPLLSAQNGGSSVSGRVVNSVTKAGIGGAELNICRTGGPTPGVMLCGEMQTAVTDDTGSFRLGGLTDGQYLVLPVPKEGFFPVLPAKPQINVSGDTRLDLEMTPMAGIRGRVFDPEGKPAVGFVVALDALGCNACTAYDVSITNPDGEFSFTGVPPTDSMILSASPKTQDPKAEEKMVTTYYPSVTDRDLAERIRTQGLDSFGYDIKLRTAPAHSVRGVVIDEGGKPVPKAIVSIVKPGSSTAVAIRGLWYGRPNDVPVAEPSQTTDDGSFTFPSVVQGNWILRAVGGDPQRAGSALVSVSDSEVDDIQIRIAPAFNIELQADWGDSPPAKVPAGPVRFLAMDSPAVLPPPPFDLEPGQVPVFQGFAGKYVLAPSPMLPAGYYLAAALLDNRDVLGQVTDLSAGDSLKMIFKTGGGAVRGMVEQGADAAVVVLMADPSASGRMGYSGRCDANGAFVVRDVPPGDYTAVALPNNLGDPLSAEFAAMLVANGKRVRVEAGSSAQIDLRLARQ